MRVVHLYIPPTFCSFWTGFTIDLLLPSVVAGITLLSPEHRLHYHVIGTDVVREPESKTKLKITSLVSSENTDKTIPQIDYTSFEKYI